MKREEVGGNCLMRSYITRNSYKGNAYRNLVRKPVIKTLARKSTLVGAAGIVL
jgi:hypothetical protein